MTTRTAVSLVAFFFCLCVPALSQVQKTPSPIAPAEPLKDGKWEKEDERFIFLMIRLASTEASLDAVEKAIGKNTGSRSTYQGQAKRAEAGNERMDRQGGGPMPWSQFYGRTAEKFFYHPLDPNTTYHTGTILAQQSPEADNRVAEGVPSRQGLPVHQRPPQFDYIYRANRNAKARAEEEVAKLNNQISDLRARCRSLEAEQSALWCEIAFRAISRQDLARKPLYRFEPTIALGDADAQQRAEAMKSAAIFMRTTLSIVAEAQKNQSKAFGNIKQVIADAREKLDDSWLRQGFLAKDKTDLKTPAGKFLALAKRLEDVASNLSDSYRVSNEADRLGSSRTFRIILVAETNDAKRKATFRALLQESLVSYAETVLALDEMATLMAADWKIKPDMDKPLGIGNLQVVYRLTLQLSEFGNGKFRIEKTSQPPTDEFSGTPFKFSNWPLTKATKGQDGMFRLVHDFRNADDLRVLALGTPINVSLEKGSEGLILTSGDMPGGFDIRQGAVFSYGKRLRLPATIICDIVKYGDAGFAIKIADPLRKVGVLQCKLWSHTQDLEHPFEVQVAWVESSNDGKKSWTNLCDKKDVTLDDQPFETRFRVRVPNEKITEPICLELARQLGTTSTTVSRLEVRSRLVPSFGMGLGQKQGMVFAKTVIHNGLAEKAGFQMGDVLSAINGKHPNTANEAIEMLSHLPIGEEVVFTIQRGGTPQELRVITE